MYEKDFIIRLIKSSTQLLASILSGENLMDNLINEQNDNITLSKDDLLSITLNKYINDGKINEAENILFEHIETCKSASNFQIALSFYKRLSLWSDEQLSKANFSRNEIIEGIKDIKKIYQKN